jgi:tetratricopeptide (TPR) repeat protein
MAALVSRILLGFILVIFSAAANATDSVTGMLAAGRVDETIVEANRQLVSTPADPELSNLLCRAYYALEDWDQAASFCKKAVSGDPGNSVFHLWLGRAYGEKADHTNFVSAASLAGKVRTEFERAVQLNPKNIEARLDLAEFYIEAPSFMGGGEEKARGQAPLIGSLSRGRDHWIYARVAEHKKDLTTAEREYRQYIETSNGDSEAWLNFALFLRRQARLPEMEEAIVKLNQAPLSKAEALVEASDTLYRCGRNHPLATQLLRRYFTSGPVEGAPAFRAHYLLGEILERQGDKAGAADEYRISLSLTRNFAPAQHALSRVTH